MSPEEITGLRALFQALDADKSGTVTLDELKAGLAKQGAAVPQKEVQALIDSMDADSNGSIDYDEFLAATVQMSQLQLEENMYRAFHHFDKDGSGTISKEELREALKALPGNLEQQVEDILREVDTNNDGSIDYDEFATMMRGMQNDRVKEAGCDTAYRKGALI